MIKASLLFLGSAFGLKVRQPAPDFTANAVINNKFERYSLSHVGEKYKVLLFYPFDFTYVCPTEIISFSEATKQF